MLAGGLELFGELLQRFPNNVHILLEIAKVRHTAHLGIQVVTMCLNYRSVDLIHYPIFQD